MRGDVLDLVAYWHVSRVKDRLATVQNDQKILSSGGVELQSTTAVYNPVTRNDRISRGRT